jgi:hypothetical protein
MFLIAVCTNNDLVEEQVSQQTVKNWIQSLNGILHYACEKKGKEVIRRIKVGIVDHYSRKVCQ